MHHRHLQHHFEKRRSRFEILKLLSIIVLHATIRPPTGRASILVASYIYRKQQKTYKNMEKHALGRINIHLWPNKPSFVYECFKHGLKFINMKEPMVYEESQPMICTFKT
jgi:hypothetical protein